jgi:RNA polymerase sigma-70 factor (ECF subfamily)
VSRPSEPVPAYAAAFAAPSAETLLSAPSVPAIAAEGAAQAFGDLFSLVYRQMAALVGSDRGDLDDLVQIAAEQAVRGIHRFRGDSALGTWTYRICYTTLLKHHRWRARWRRRFHLTSDGKLPELALERTGAADALEQIERIERLRSAVAALPPKRRAVVVLHDLEGLDLGEICRIVDARLGTVKSRLRDGRRALARLLGDDPYFGDRACRTQEEAT